MWKWILSLLIVFFTNAMFANGGALVLCYHTFIDQKHNDFDTSPEEFGKQITEMKQLGYRFVSYDDITNAEIEGYSNVLITIDDGNRSVKKIYDSILKANGIKPVLFVYPAITDRMHYALKTEDLKAFEDEGATIGGHGYYHLFINQKLYDQDLQSFNKEIFKSKSALEKKLSTKITVFAYPFGVFSPITKETLKQAGYECSFSLRHGYLEVPLARNPDLYDLPRYMVTHSTWNTIYAMMKSHSNNSERIVKRKEYEKS